MSAPGKEPWRAELTTSDGKSTELDVPRLEDAERGSPSSPIRAIPLSKSDPAAHARLRSQLDEFAATGRRLRAMPEAERAQDPEGRKTLEETLFRDDDWQPQAANGSVPKREATLPAGEPTSVETAADPTWLIPTGLALGKASDAHDGCPRGLCSAAGDAARASADAFANAATGMFVGGGLLAGAGIVMLVLAPWEADPSVAKPARTRAAPTFYSPAELGLGLAGKF